MDPGSVVSGWFTAHPELEVEREGERWFTVLTGEHKRTIGVRLSVGEHTLIVESHFMREPDENHAEVYRFLLSRNTSTYVLRFCVYESGDVMLVGVLPAHAVTADELDRVLGQVLAVSDGAFDAALRRGFGSYIAREQEWRKRVGLSPNPITLDHRGAP